MSSNLAYQDGPWEELIDGKVVAMSPRPTSRHNTLSDNIFYIFRHYLRKKQCRPLSDGWELHLTEKDHFIPDMMVVCDPSKIKWNCVQGAPDLVVEVLSPATAKRDKGYKKQVYQSCGVREYWIINGADRTVEQYFLEEGTLVLHEVYTLYPDYMLESMTPEEKAAIPASFKCSLFDDLEIELSEVFYRVDEGAM